MITREDLEVGKMTERLEAKVTPAIDAEVVAVEKELAAGGDRSMLRSRAIRHLIIEGILARHNRRDTHG